MGEHLYFHASGRIIAQPEATEDDITELLTLARRIADTTSRVGRVEVLNQVVGAFYDSVMANVLCREPERRRIRSVLQESEEIWLDTRYDEPTRNVAAAQR
jgi:hypothetical protein